jgi:hypothetical protein
MYVYLSVVLGRILANCVALLLDGEGQPCYKAYPFLDYQLSLVISRLNCMIRLVKSVNTACTS